MKQTMIDFLLENANPSIILRVKRDILNNLSVDEEAELLIKIIAEKNVQTVLQSQKSDGWFGNAFHGSSPTLGAGMYDNMEVGLRYLAEKGFPPESEYIKRAVNSFLLDEPHYKECRMKAPDDDYTLTALGLFHARSSIIIRAGYEYLLPPNDYIDLKYDINHSFKTFVNVLNYASPDDVIDTTKRKLCFKSGTLWPCSYDLRILAHSQGWRNEKNHKLLSKAVNKLFTFEHDHEKMVYTHYKGYYKNPCFAFIHNAMTHFDFANDSFIDFDSTELFARCGVIKDVPVLKNKYERLLSDISDALSVGFSAKIKASDRSWGPYGGYALEEDWRTKTRKQCDLLFRVLLIHHYAECVI